MGAGRKSRNSEVMLLRRWRLFPRVARLFSIRPSVAWPSINKPVDLFPFNVSHNLLQERSSGSCHAASFDRTLRRRGVSSNSEREFFWAYLSGFPVILFLLFFSFTFSFPQFFCHNCTANVVPKQPARRRINPDSCAMAWIKRSHFIFILHLRGAIWPFPAE